MQLSSSLTRSRDLSPQSRDQLYPISVGTAGHVTGQEGHVTSLTSWRDACDISARSFGLPTIYERPIMLLKLQSVYRVKARLKHLSSTISGRLFALSTDRKLTSARFIKSSLMTQ